MRLTVAVLSFDWSLRCMEDLWSRSRWLSSASPNRHGQTKLEHDAETR